MPRERVFGGHGGLKMTCITPHLVVWKAPDYLETSDPFQSVGLCHMLASLNIPQFATAVTI